MLLTNSRKRFLLKMIREAMIPYEHPGEEWSVDEKEFLPFFLTSLKPNSLILDLAGGYGRVTPWLIGKGNHVVLADLSIHSLRLAKKTLKGKDVDLVRLDMLNLPFRKNLFDAVWFTQAFEYVPPDLRECFLRNLNEVLKENGILFVNVAHVPGECSLFSYFKNYIYWKLIKRQPIKLGDYIYKLSLENREVWHYHSVVFTRRIERTFRRSGFRILKFRNYGKKAYLTFLLKAKHKKGGGVV